MELAELHAIAEQERAARKPVRIRCCAAAGCVLSGSLKVKECAGGRRAASRRWATASRSCEVGCMRLCCEGPLVQVDPAGPLYERVEPEAMPRRSCRRPGRARGRRCSRADPHQPFFTRQMAIVLENCGSVEPGRIESYIEAGGYQALHHVLREMTPAQVVDEVTRSGLRGRGGAGYPTGLKWATVAKQPAQPQIRRLQRRRGRPGAFMDRSVMESDPHRVLEGMAIAGYAVGADQRLYLRPRRIPHGHRTGWTRRSSKPGSCGLLGSQIFESPFDFRLDIRIGAGAFVCGEETALIALDRGPARHAAASAPLPRRSRPLGHAHADQQRRDVRQHAADHPTRAATGSRRSAPPRARGPRSSPWPARSATRGWSRCRWA